ncbi:MAG TPA: hypothetical protein VKK79_03595 [Candidatus Lokiarchaeia archaeon]|nr:hypothetical protein [Candidatus Lokiarchaeia archaeon]
MRPRDPAFFYAWRYLEFQAEREHTLCHSFWHAAGTPSVRLLGLERDLTWHQAGADFAVELSENLPASPSYAIAITPKSSLMPPQV